ncbi:MAG: hypothetical protein IJM47_06990 [Synergistaceae bacterium]|nr:hypothetical protein [Synergistaceae bacterium]
MNMKYIPQLDACNKMVQIYFDSGEKEEPSARMIVAKIPMMLPAVVM